QAEDGIRDLIVTGVQTCALPISASWCLCTTTHPACQSCVVVSVPSPINLHRWISSSCLLTTDPVMIRLVLWADSRTQTPAFVPRSEERRVGTYPIGARSSYSRSR